MVKIERCRHGHLLDADNRYDEVAAGGRTVVRCRKCRAAQRRHQGARQRTAPGRLDLTELVARQRPGPDDITRALELWRNGTAGDACRKAGVTASQIARVAGCHPATARSWLTGTPPQRRYQTAATSILAAIGTLTAPEIEGPTARTGDSILLIGGTPNRDGPWHHTPPHSGVPPAIDENWYATGSPTGPKAFAWWPCAGFVTSLTHTRDLLTSHGYLDDPRTFKAAAACHHSPGWRPDCPIRGADCQGIQLITAAGVVHTHDLYNGNGCTPDTCPDRAERDARETSPRDPPR